MADKTFYCNFCGKAQYEVRKLIAGPTVFICDQCVELCMDIIGDDQMDGEAEYLSWEPTLQSQMRKPTRIQRAFHQWFEESASSFAIPLTIESRTKRCLTMVLQNGAWPIPVNLIRLNGHEIHIDIVWDHCSWDLLYCNDMVETKKVPDGYICPNCLPEAQKVFPSREALWRDHLFEPFLQWVNEKLAKSRAIGLFGERNHTTWASLLPDTSETDRLAEGEPVHLIPISR